MMLRRPSATLFPYTTLFRSVWDGHGIHIFGARNEVVAFQIILFGGATGAHRDRKSTRLNSSHLGISYAVFRLKKKSHLTITARIVKSLLCSLALALHTSRPR